VSQKTEKLSVQLHSAHHCMCTVTPTANFNCPEKPYILTFSVVDD